MNREKAAKRRKSYSKKLAKYRASETFKVVEQRAAGRCEFEIRMRLAPDFVEGVERCPATEGLEHHHKRYGRQFGGNERPEDLEVLCKQHHAFVENRDAPHRRHGR